MEKTGILGGGQLGRMLIQQGLNYNLEFSVLDPDADCACSKISHHFTQGDFRNEEDVYNFGKGLDVLTIEIEHVHAGALKKLSSEGVKVFPQPEIIELIQDKGLQKQFYSQHDIPTSRYALIDSLAQLETLEISFPVMQKLRKGGYDGRGVTAIRSAGDLDKAFDAPSVIEELEQVDLEISVLVARDRNGSLKTYPPVELVFNSEANLVEYLISPARITDDMASGAITIAEKVASSLGITGLLAVELFVTSAGDILVNEIAPRPHNSGHQTIEGNLTSQYDQHLRAIMGWPLGDTSLRGSSVMINLLGEKDHQGLAKIEGYDKILATPGAYLHWYGKGDTRPFRKMGHITVVSDSTADCLGIADELKNIVRIIS